jgi:hypothetical protein
VCCPPAGVGSIPVRLASSSLSSFCWMALTSFRRLPCARPRGVPWQRENFCVSFRASAFERRHQVPTPGEHSKREQGDRQRERLSRAPVETRRSRHAPARRNRLAMAQPVLRVSGCCVARAQPNDTLAAPVASGAPRAEASRQVDRRADAEVSRHRLHFEKPASLATHAEWTSPDPQSARLGAR